VNTGAVSDPYKCHRFPTEIISYAVWLYYRFTLSLETLKNCLPLKGFSQLRSDLFVVWQIRH
jgi:putative transposase